MRQTQAHESKPLWKAGAERGTHTPETASAERRPEVVSSGPIDALPPAREARSLRQAAVLHMQRHQGNAFVQRQMDEEPTATESQPADQTPTEEQAPGQGPGAEQNPIESPLTPPEQAPTEGDPGVQTPEAGASNQIGGDGSSVRAEAGGVTIDGGQLTVSTGMVNLNSAVVTTSGVLRAPTLIADTVVASSYTPGVGNVQ